jgi:hypothetical protein
MKNNLPYNFHEFAQKLYMSQYQIFYLIFKIYTSNSIVIFILAVIENFQILSLFFNKYVKYN